MQTNRNFRGSGNIVHVDEIIFVFKAQSYRWIFAENKKDAVLIVNHFLETSKIRKYWVELIDNESYEISTPVIINHMITI